MCFDNNYNFTVWHFVWLFINAGLYSKFMEVTEAMDSEIHWFQQTAKALTGLLSVNNAHMCVFHC